MWWNFRPLQVLGSTWSVQRVKRTFHIFDGDISLSMAGSMKHIWSICAFADKLFWPLNKICKDIWLNNLGLLILYFRYRNWPVAIMSFILTSLVCILYQCLFFRWQLSFLCNSNFSASLCNVTYTKTTHNTSFEDLQKAFAIWNMKKEAKKHTPRRINALDRWAAAYQETQLHNQVHT